MEKIKINKLDVICCTDCQYKCYEYENSIVSAKAYNEWARKESMCKELKLRKGE